jgi:cyclophilin family peptidyl-prolyl cis-trans isomerase
MKSLQPQLTPAEVKRILVETSHEMTFEGNVSPHTVDAAAPALLWSPPLRPNPACTSPRTLASLTGQAEAAPLAPRPPAAGRRPQAPKKEAPIPLSPVPSRSRSWPATPGSPLSGRSARCSALYNLVKNGFFDNVRFFRVIGGFMAQFGIHGDPGISAAWRNARIPDDPVKQSNKRGYITFATAGPGTRTTQVFINLVDNGTLDAQGFAPFGRVVSGMKVVDKLYDGYGEGAPHGRGPDQSRVQMEGNAYLEKSFPKLDYIKTASIAE